MALSETVVFNVKRSERELIVPKQLNPHEVKQLSDVDVQPILQSFIPLIFFYHNSSGIQKSGIDPVEKIREGLAKALAFYYPLAGRILEGPNGKLVVNCNNEGVIFVEADANVKLEQLGNAIFPPCPYLEKFLYGIPGPAEISCPIFLQVTRFVCGGFALGIMLNHMMMDGHGLMLFLHAIAELVKVDASAPSIIPTWQRELLNARSPPRITCTHNEFDFTLQTKSQLDFLEDDVVQTSIFFSHKDVQALRHQLPAQVRRSCSRFDLITACLWKCRTVALEPHPNEDVRLSITVDLRHLRHKKRIDIPMSYYGNAVLHCPAVSNAEVLCSSPLSYAVDLIRKSKARVNEEYARSSVDCIGEGYKYVMRWKFFVSDTTNFGFDKVDFGWGEPLYGGLSWSASGIGFYSVWKNIDKGEDGVIVSTALPSLAVEKFQKKLRKMTIEPISKL